MHDVGVGHEVQPAAGADPVDRGDDRLPHLVVPGRQAQLGTARAPGLLAQGVGIPAQLDHVEAGLERAALARVHDHPHSGIRVQLAPGRFELVEHDGVHGVAGIGGG